MGSHGMQAVSPMSGCPTFDTDIKKQKRDEFITPSRTTGRRSKKSPKIKNQQELVPGLLLTVRLNWFFLRSSFYVFLNVLNKESLEYTVKAIAAIIQLSTMSRTVFKLFASCCILFSSEHRENNRPKIVNDKQERTAKILTDTLLNIERKGKFPKDVPCPYLGVRKPIRGRRYPNDYDGITCKPHR